MTCDLISEKKKFFFFEFIAIFYFLLYNKNIRFDFDDELKIGDVRYKHLTYK